MPSIVSRFTSSRSHLAMAPPVPRAALPLRNPTAIVFHFFPQISSAYGGTMEWPKFTVSIFLMPNQLTHSYTHTHTHCETLKTRTWIRQINKWIACKIVPPMWNNISRRLAVHHLGIPEAIHHVICEFVEVTNLLTRVRCSHNTRWILEHLHINDFKKEQGAVGTNGGA